MKVQYTSTWTQKPLKKCKFSFYYNTTGITPTVLDGGNKIILANWPNDKHFICKINNDIPIKIPHHPYMLVYRSVLCNCGIEVENHFLLELLAACQDSSSKLIMYFTINTSFVYYLDQFPNLTESLELLIRKTKTSFEQTLPISLNVSKFDSYLLTASNNLKNFIHQYTHKKDIFDLNERHDNMASITNNIFF